MNENNEKVISNVNSKSKEERNVPNLRFSKYNYNWIIAHLDDVANVVGGGTPDTSISSYWNGNIQFFTPTEIGHSKYVTFSKQTISKQGLLKSNAKMLPKGTILLSSRATIGECSITLVECATNQGFQNLIAKQNIYNEFLYYMVQTKRKHFIKYACGSTFLEISNNEIKKTKCSIPCIEEQKNIASLLTKIDERIETQSKIINSIQSQINSINHVIINRSKELIPLHEICTFEFKTNRKSNDGLPKGKYPFFTNEEEQTQYLNEYDFDGQYIIANTGGKANFRYFNGKFASMSDCLVIKIMNTDLTYFYSNVLKDKQSYINYVGFEGSGIKHLNKEWLLNFLVPKYNSSIQNYITIIKNIMNKLKIEKNILELYKKQKAYLLQNMFI